MITSTSNKQIKRLQQLQKKGKLRREEDVFIIEGVRMFQEVPEDHLKQIYVSGQFLEREENKKLLEGKNYEVLDNQVFKAVSDTKTPQGILCVVKQFHYNIEEILSKPSPVFLVLEDLQDPGNLGTIMRTAEGAGVTAVILNQTCVDMYLPKTIRSTMGSVYRLPFLYVESLTELMPRFQEKEIVTYAAHLDGANDYDKEDYRKGTAFFIGNEGNGLSDYITKSVEKRIKIPMEGKLESLNAAVASAILMYEAYRQRR